MGPTQRMSAGTTILVDRKTAPLVVDSGILMEGRAQFIKLQAAGSGTLTIVNVYAAQTSRNQALLWKTISRAELDSDSTIIGGDFNHQEETSRRGIAGERQMHRREATSWHHMTLQYSLTDAWCSNSFRKMSKKAFTFDNGRLGANSAISKIDKFMVSQDLDSRGGENQVRNHNQEVLGSLTSHHLHLGAGNRHKQASVLLRHLLIKGREEQGNPTPSLGQRLTDPTQRPGLGVLD